MNRFRRLTPLVPLALFGAAMYWLYGRIEADHYRGAISYLESIPPSRIAIALAFTAAGYLALTGYDWLGIRFAGIDLPYRSVAFASSVAYSFENTVGHGFLPGTPLRVRLYGARGATAEQIGQLLGFCFLTFWLGFLTLGGVYFALFPESFPLWLESPWPAGRSIGIVLLLLLAGYLVAAATGRPDLELRGWSLEFPTLPLASGQLLVSTADWAAAGTALFVLLPEPEISWIGCLGAFLLAWLVGALSRIPGGLGVFETAMVILLGTQIGEGRLLGVLVLYRIVYFLVPVVAAALGLAGVELYRQRARVERMVGAVTGMGAAIVPHAMAFTTFLAGAILLLTGATPPPSSRLSWLQEALPLPVIEASHFLASVAGGLLLVLARGLQRRLDVAYQATLGLLGGGVVFALLRGLDWGAAIALAVMFVALAPLHEAFDRKAAFFEARFSPGWAAAVVLILATTGWLTLFAFRNVPYSQELWWTFALRGDAPRALRALVAASAVLLVFGLYRLVRPAPPEPDPPGPEELDRAVEIAYRSPRAYAFLALLGDKRLLFGQEGDSYLMYAVQGRSWISLGDPVGPEGSTRRLAWRFQEMAEHHADWPVFYQVSDERLPHYVDMGLSLLKIGEEGRVPLRDFSLEGGKRKEMRQVIRRTEEREGGRFELLPRDRVPDLVGRLREVSDAWLADKSAAEKGFSLGFFDLDYVARFPLATVWVEDRLVAFANVFATGPKVELSLDLMRYVSDAPPGVMTYLFVKLMQWGAENGYDRFSLGMAPLAGLGELPGGPLWNRLGDLVYRHGENFYNFQGLRAYKNKFGPEWEPRYLASPGGLALPQVLTNLTTLISGGVTHVFRR